MEKNLLLLKKGLPFFICFCFFILYSTLALIKHNHFLSGYDLGIVDQVIWLYSRLQAPITTVHAYYNTSSLTDHVEIIYILLSPFYWLYPDAKTILLLQTAAISSSGMAIYLLARKKGLSFLMSLTLLLGYLSFYGFQHAIWADVHSLVFAVSFLAWFCYFLEKGDTYKTYIFFFLAILCKEDIALLTFLISFIHFFVTRKRQSLIFMALSILYLAIIFFLYFPFFTTDGYRYGNPNGIVSDIQPSYMFDTPEKQQVILYSLGWFGFLPLLSPFYLLPALGDLAHYFVLGHAIVSSAQGLYLHYRSSLALFLVLPTIITIARFKRLQSKWIIMYLIFCMMFFQYQLHVPLTYLTKSWFWHEPSEVKHIQQIITSLPKDASVVSQNNITPHISHRSKILTLFPQKRSFTANSPCGAPECAWFRWEGNQKYLIVDIGNEWDARHFLINREEFVQGIRNLEKYGVIKKYKQSGEAIIYKINKNPKL